jgi:hypothetical protein
VLQFGEFDTSGILPHACSDEFLLQLPRDASLSKLMPDVKNQEQRNVIRIEIELIRSGGQPPSELSIQLIQGLHKVVDVNDFDPLEDAAINNSSLFVGGSGGKIGYFLL